jgi:hypothetical protein
MTTLEKSARRFLAQRGFTMKRGFWKYLPERSLLVEVALRPVKPAIGGRHILGYAIGLHVYYPVHDRFILVWPEELADLRKDGTLRHVVYLSEHDGIFEKTEAGVVEVLLQQCFDFWYEKLTEPSQALDAIEAIRGRASLPSYLTYLSRFIARDDADKLQFAARQEACVFPFDGGVNFTAYVAYLNAAGRFADASRLIQEAAEEDYFRGRPHASVAVRGSLQKLAHDATQNKIALSGPNVRELEKLGLVPG